VRLAASVRATLQEQPERVERGGCERFGRLRQPGRVGQGFEVSGVKC
jgi:hypothetical protein